MPLRLLPLILIGLIAVSPASARAQVPVSHSGSLFADLGFPEIVLTATDYHLTLSQTEISAGRYLVTLHNESWNPDLEVSIVELGAENLAADTSCVNGFPPECFDWYYQTRLPGGVSGQSPQVILDLARGTYGLWGPGEISILPAATLTVTGETDTSVNNPEPAASSIVVAEDNNASGFILEIEGEFRPGPQVVRIVNATDQPLLIEAMQDPWPSSSEQSGVPQVPDSDDKERLARVLSTSPQSPDTEQWVSMELTPGSVYLACYILDPVVMAYASHWDPSATAVVPVLES